MHKYTLYLNSQVCASAHSAGRQDRKTGGGGIWELRTYWGTKCAQLCSRAAGVTIVLKISPWKTPTEGCKTIKSFLVTEWQVFFSLLLICDSSKRLYYALVYNVQKIVQLHCEWTNTVHLFLESSPIQMLRNHIWFLLWVQTLLVNVTLWQAQSLVTAILPWGAAELSLPLKRVDYTVVDSKQREDRILNFLFVWAISAKTTFPQKKWIQLMISTIVVIFWDIVSNDAWRKVSKSFHLWVTENKSELISLQSLSVKHMWNLPSCHLLDRKETVELSGRAGNW